LTDELKKKIDMMNLLQVPYNSAQLIDAESPNTVTFSVKLEIEKSWHGLKYSVKDNPISSDAIKNHLPENFIIDSDREHFVVECQVNQSRHELTATGTSWKSLEFTHMILAALKDSYSIPKTVKMTCTFNRTRNEEDRSAYFNRVDGGTPEEVLNRIFGAKVNERRLEEVKGSYRGSWRSPFTEGSLKARIFSREKFCVAFLIEYFWGKKLSKNATNEQFARFLASAQNLRFGICDTQLANKFTEILRHTSIKALKSDLEAFGIKPATDLSRWYRMGYLEQVDKQEQVK